MSVPPGSNIGNCGLYNQGFRKNIISATNFMNVDKIAPKTEGGVVNVAGGVSSVRGINTSMNDQVIDTTISHPTAIDDTLIVGPGANEATWGPNPGTGASSSSSFITAQSETVLPNNRQIVNGNATQAVATVSPNRLTMGLQDIISSGITASANLTVDTLGRVVAIENGVISFNGETITVDQTVNVSAVATNNLGTSSVGTATKSNFYIRFTYQNTIPNAPPRITFNYTINVPPIQGGPIRLRQPCGIYDQASGDMVDIGFLLLGSTGATFAGLTTPSPLVDATVYEVRGQVQGTRTLT